MWLFCENFTVMCALLFKRYSQQSFTVEGPKSSTNNNRKINHWVFRAKLYIYMEIPNQNSVDFCFRSVSVNVAISRPKPSESVVPFFSVKREFSLRIDLISILIVYANETFANYSIFPIPFTSYFHFKIFAPGVFHYRRHRCCYCCIFWVHKITKIFTGKVCQLNNSEMSFFCSFSELIIARL